jgi:P27 family predicted phage terminase small subunit
MPAHRTSTVTKLLRGTDRADRKPKRDFAARLNRAPPPPAHLSERAQGEWKAVGKAAVGVGTLTQGDLRAFELLAVTLATEAEAREVIAAEGMTVNTGDGGKKPHPAVRMMETARTQAASLLAAFGLTPKSRQSIDQAPQSQADKYLDDPAERFFQKHGPGR